jgi:hypothetical protein
MPDMQSQGSCGHFIARLTERPPPMMIDIEFAVALLSWVTNAAGIPTLTPIAFDPLVLIAVILVAIGLVSFFGGYALKLAGWNKKPTRIRLSNSFPGTPVETGHSNLWYWSWLWVSSNFQRPNNGPDLEHVGSVFVWIFDRPAHYRQIKITGQGIVLPAYEIKQRTDRHCIVWFMDKVPDGEIEFELVF